MDDRVTFFLYERVYCHLCHEMEAALVSLLHEIGDGREFAIVTIDVDADDDLEQRYGERVPVLVVDGRELCHYFLEVTAVRAYLAEIH